MTTKRILIISLITVALGFGWALDFANRGLVWQFAWSVTGREDAVGQVRGLVQYAGNALRPAPRTDPMTPIDHVNVNPYGINTFFEQEPDPAKVDAGMEMIADAGFTWIRQQFIWADIEINAKGDFLDDRNDVTGDGQIDIIDAWAKYDRIVDAAERNGIQIQARVDVPPPWSRALPEDVTGAFAPPDDFQDYVDFAVILAERYHGRIWHYQIWNEPNIFPEWGNASVNPEAYTELLCRTYDALKAVDPNIIVISGALAPTQALTGRDLNDYIFLQRMYQAGAGDCFDVLSMQGYGLRSGPTDRRMRPTLVNISRNRYVRDLMIANGDAHKPIWISEAAWNFVPSRDEAPDIAEPRDMFGQVTMDQAADYITGLYARAQSEWPWVGVVNYWYFTRRSDEERNQPFYYFRMVEPDFDPSADPPFQPLPVYDAMRDYIAATPPTLYRGVHQAADHWALTFADGATVAPYGAEFSRSVQTTGVDFRAHGTDLLLRWRGVGQINVNGTAIDGTPVGDWYSGNVRLATEAGAHQVSIDAGGESFVLESVTVLDRTWHNRYPYLILGALAVILLAVALMDMRRGRA